jgi:LPXTG-motif cell wall-anchored protein
MVSGVCTAPQGCPEGEALMDGTCQPTPDCVPSEANNQCQPTSPVTCPADAELSADGTTCVLGEKVTRPPTTVEGDTIARTPGSLPFTGANVDGLLLAGLTALGGGIGLLAAGRRRRRT